MSRQPVEDREYEVGPAQLRWAMSALGQQYPVMGYQPQPGGVYIIIVQQPAGSPDLDWRNMQPRRGADPLRRLGISLGVVLIVACVGWLAYAALTGAGWRPPWAGAPGEPVATQDVPAPAGWTLPNPAQGVEDAADAVSQAVVLLVRVGLAVLALAGVWLLRGLLGPLARGVGQMASAGLGRLRR